LALRAGQKARAGRSTSAWLAHKADIGAPHTSDEAIVSQFDDICLMLYLLIGMAQERKDRAWLRRHVWLRALAHQLRNKKPGTPLDGQT
jgi:hypothetical protein